MNYRNISIKGVLLAASLSLGLLSAEAQTLKQTGNFSLFQQYFNPGLTGYEGSMGKLFYRNQWGGFEGAPETIFASIELDMADLGRWKSQGTVVTEEEINYVAPGAKNAFGLLVFHDTDGPFTETQIHLSYGSRVQLTAKTQLRLGAALTFNQHRMDGSKMRYMHDQDQIIDSWFGRFAAQNRMDFNAGLMLTSDDYYFGYALQDLAKGRINGGDDFMNEGFAMQHVVQGGYRRALTDQFGMVFNGIYRYDDRLGKNAEGQIKGVFMNTAWLGAGYRWDLAYTMTVGFRVGQMRLGYSYEIPSGDARQISSSTNEFVATMNLNKVRYPKYLKKVLMW